MIETQITRYCLLSVFPFAYVKERFLHSYKQCFVLRPNRCRISQSTPFRGLASSQTLVPFSNRCGTPNPSHMETSVLAGTPPCVYPIWGSASSLAHCPVSGSDTICNNSIPPQIDIVLFELSLLDFSSRFLKRVCQGEVYTPL